MNQPVFPAHAHSGKYELLYACAGGAGTKRRRSADAQKLSLLRKLGVSIYDHAVGLSTPGFLVFGIYLFNLLFVKASINEVHVAS